MQYIKQIWPCGSNSLFFKSENRFDINSFVILSFDIPYLSFIIGNMKYYDLVSMGNNYVLWPNNTMTEHTPATVLIFWLDNSLHNQFHTTTQMAQLLVATFWMTRNDNEDSDDPSEKRRMHFDQMTLCWIKKMLANDV